MKKPISLLVLIFGLAFASVLAKVEFGDCPDEVAENCKKFIDKSKCCGTKRNICCSEEEYYSQFPNFGDAQAEPQIVITSKEFLLIVATIIVPLFVVCCICCFRCPFCLLAKHRNGRVIRQNDEAQPQEQRPRWWQKRQQPPHQQIIHTIPMQPNPPQQDYPIQALPLASESGYGYPQSGQSSNIMPYPDDPPPYPGRPLAKYDPKYDLL